MTVKSDTIQLEIKDKIASITLNRPEVFNSFNREMALEFQSALDYCDADPNIRIVLVRGAGKAFCSGQDLKEITNLGANADFKKIVETHYNPIITKIRKLKKPVVAAVNGVAAGAGANVALACDIVVADQRATFIQAFSLIGLIPDSGGTFFLPRLLGFQKASALAMLGDKVTACEAEKMGMIYRSVSAEEFDQVVVELANKLASMPTKALYKTKELLNQSATNTLEEQLHMEAICQTDLSRSEDYQEGVLAFVEKRKPIFNGR